MTFRIIATAATALCLGWVAVAVAQDNPVATRERLMKQVASSSGALRDIARGSKPFDARAVRAALTTISTDMKSFPDQFPAGSEANSSAAPAIWENMEDFRARSLKLAGDADAVLASMPADAAGVQTALQTLGASCGACHETYRLKR